MQPLYFQARIMASLTTRLNYMGVGTHSAPFSRGDLRLHTLYMSVFELLHESTA
jgi:hypothetical protein